MAKNEYTGIYRTGSPRRPFKVMVRVGPELHYLGSYGFIEEALDAWNNAAYYLGKGCWGIFHPLQGPEELQDKYKAPAYCKPEEHDEYIAPMTEETAKLVAWAEKNLPQVAGSEVKLSQVPSSFLVPLREIRSQIAKARQDFNAQLDALERLTFDMARRLDPEEQKLDKEERQIIEWLNYSRNKDNPECQQELEKFYTRNPHRRPKGSN